MADFSVSVTVEDAKVNDLILALRHKWGQVEDPPGSGTFRDRTPAELRAEFKKRVEQNLRDIFFEYKRHLRDQTPVDGSIVVS